MSFYDSPSTRRKIKHSYQYPGETKSQFLDRRISLLKTWLDGKRIENEMNVYIPDGTIDEHEH